MGPRGRTTRKTDCIVQIRQYFTIGRFHIGPGFAHVLNGAPAAMSSMFSLSLILALTRPPGSPDIRSYSNVDPVEYLTDVLTRIVNLHPNSQIDYLLPWTYCVPQTTKAVA